MAVSHAYGRPKIHSVVLISKYITLSPTTTRERILQNVLTLKNGTLLNQLATWPHNFGLKSLENELFKNYEMQDVAYRAQVKAICRFVISVCFIRPNRQWSHRELADNLLLTTDSDSIATGSVFR